MRNFQKLIVALGLVGLCGCSFFAGITDKPPKEANEPRGELVTLTGQVIRAEGEYRFRPLKETEALRLSKAGGTKEAVAEEMNLRKYFGKTLVVRGERKGEWIIRAQVMGQWLRPGEKRGSTLLGPEPKPTP
jgi:hypothetical protein